MTLMLKIVQSMHQMQEQLLQRRTVQRRRRSSEEALSFTDCPNGPSRVPQWIFRIGCY